MPDNEQRITKIEAKIETLQQDVTMLDKKLDMNLMEIKHSLNRSVIELTNVLERVEKDFRQYQQSQKSILGWIGKNFFNIISSLIILYLAIQLGLK